MSTFLVIVLMWTRGCFKEKHITNVTWDKHHVTKNRLYKNLLCHLLFVILFGLNRVNRHTVYWTVTVTTIIKYVPGHSRITSTLSGMGSGIVTTAWFPSGPVTVSWVSSAHISTKYTPVSSSIKALFAVAPDIREPLSQEETNNFRGWQPRKNSKSAYLSGQSLAV